MWHKFKKCLFSYYSKKRVNRVMGVNGIMRIGHNCLPVENCLLFINCVDLASVATDQDPNLESTYITELLCIVNTCPAEPGYTLPLKKPTDLDLHCLSL